MKTWVSTLSVFLVSSLLTASSALALQLPIDRFAQVSPGVFRSARPSLDALESAAQAGIKTIVNLENDDDAISSEKPYAESLGMTEFSLPMSGFWAPDDDTVDAALSIIADPARQPVLVHCQHGEDRTGLIIGLYRVEREHWAPADAYQEMLDHGFHQLLLGLNHYFEERTGFED